MCANYITFKGFYKKYIGFLFLLFYFIYKPENELFTFYSVL